MSAPQPIRDDYYSEAALAAELCCHKRTLKRWRDLRQGPAHTTIGRAIFYRREAVRDWLISREVQPA
jgi:hypothetical protein